MLSLNDPIWQILEGGYKIGYDVSKPLKELETATDIEIIEKGWNEL